MSNFICWNKIKATMLTRKLRYVMIVLFFLIVWVTVHSERNAQDPELLFDEKSENINDVSVKLRQLQEENARLQNIIEKEKSKESGVDLQQLSEQLNKMHNENIKLQEIVANIKTTATKKYPDVKFLPEKDRKRILVTGGAGFVGSHLVDRLMLEGNEVTVVDNFFTGRKRNIEHWIGHENFELINHDIVSPLYIEVDEIYHLACPASPPHYMYNPIKTIKTSSIGTLNMLGLAKRVNAVLLLASSSEVYGDPEVHPQNEEYWGHVNPIGPRACYDEGKRVAETMCYSYHNQDGVEVRIARIFNTYGPRMHMADGRVVSNFILQALQNEPMTVYGSGSQTRSFQYVSDLVDGLIRLMNSNVSSPVNIGNHEEHTIIEFAQIIKKMINSKSEILHKEAAVDDPQKRKPDISKAARELNWKPVVPLNIGLNKTIAYFSEEIRQSETNKRNMYFPTVV